MDSIYRARSATDSSSLTKQLQKSQVVLVDIPKNLAENDNIVAEHVLSSEITQSPGRSSDTSDGSENSKSFEDNGRLDEEYYEDGESSKEEGSETLQVRRSTRESKAQWKKDIIEEMVSLEKNQTCSLVRISTRKKESQRLWMFKVKEEQNGRKGALNDTSTQHKSEGFQLAGQKEILKCSLKEILYGLIQAPRQRYLKFDSLMQKDKMKDKCSKKQVLGYVLTVGVTTVEWESRLQKSVIMLTMEV
ncbi:hypothetical protein Tco_0903418 [Tanacetum coccineum]